MKDPGSSGRAGSALRPYRKVMSMDDALKEAWGAQPDAVHDVVIVLRADAEDIAPETLGLERAEPVPYQPGMFKAKMAGSELLDLVDRPEIEDISPDYEVEAFVEDQPQQSNPRRFPRPV